MIALKENLYEDAFVKISLNKNIDTIEYAWKDFVNFETHVKLLEKIYEFTKEHDCKKNLIDMRDMKVIPNEVQTWVIKNWLPKMLQIGMNTVALVNSKSVIAKMSIKQLEQRVPLKEGELTNAFFDSIEEARNWLATK